MKAAEHLQSTTGEMKVTVVRRLSTVDRRKKLVRLLSELLDSPDTPDEPR